MNNNIDNSKNKTNLVLIVLRWTICILYLISIAGIVYFLNYNPSKAGTKLAIACYIGAFLGMIAMIIYGRHGIKKSFSEDIHSSAHRNKTILMLAILYAGEIIINWVSKYISWPNRFTFGLILSLLFISTVCYFAFYKKPHNK